MASIYPIVAYGDPILRKQATAMEPGTDVKALAEDMIATMELAQGVGLAAPQIGQGMRIFVAALAPPHEEAQQARRHNKVFINPTLTIDTATPSTSYDEGCLSIPGIIVPVLRKERLIISYFDKDWQPHEEAYTGFSARVLQHEYDHLEGKLHIDYATPLKKRMLKGKLNDIKRGNVEAPYKMRFPT
ncbi:MAG: peptide deformylase [Bacteroidota bacterium]